jgi:hypothetical protein
MHHDGRILDPCCWRAFAENVDGLEMVHIVHVFYRARDWESDTQSDVLLFQLG